MSLIVGYFSQIAYLCTKTYSLIFATQSKCIMGIRLRLLCDCSVVLKQEG